MPEIPSQLTSAPEARHALLAYADEFCRPIKLGAPGNVLSRDLHIRGPFRAAKKQLAELDRSPGPGPVVRAVPDEGAAHLVGRQQTPPGRQVIDVRVPGGEYGPTPAGPAGRLAELVANVAVTQGLAARCVAAATVDAERGGRSRQVRALQREAQALLELAVDLEDQVPDVGALFLDQWRSEAAKKAPATPKTPPPPPIRPIQLR